MLGIETFNDPVRAKDTIVYLPSMGDEAEAVAAQCYTLCTKPFILVAVTVENWNDNLTPWRCEGIFADDAPFAGKAEAQLASLERNVKAFESKYKLTPSHRIIAGYSLAGLFAAWAPFHTALFDAVASASGSLWYPGFSEYVQQHNLMCPLNAAYFSLGSKEAKTPSRLLRNVNKGTDAVIKAFESKGVPTFFGKNPGNHFKEPDLRMAKAIAWTVNSLSEYRKEECTE